MCVCVCVCVCVNGSGCIDASLWKLTKYIHSGSVLRSDFSNEGLLHVIEYLYIVVFADGGKYKYFVTVLQYMFQVSVLYWSISVTFPLYV